MACTDSQAALSTKCLIDYSQIPLMRLVPIYKSGLNSVPKLFCACQIAFGPEGEGKIACRVLSCCSRLRRGLCLTSCNASRIPSRCFYGRARFSRLAAGHSMQAPARLGIMWVDRIANPMQPDEPKLLAAMPSSPTYDTLYIGS
jgi:hypothetical protein